MRHKETRTLHLLGEFSQKNQIHVNMADDKEMSMVLDLGELISTQPHRKSSSSERLLGIPDSLWYVAMVGMFVYLMREIVILNDLMALFTKS